MSSSCSDGVADARLSGAGISAIYPASFVSRHLVPGAETYRQRLSVLRSIDKEVAEKRDEYWRKEDALVEMASKLLTSKDSNPEDLQAFLSSADFADLSAHQQDINDVRTQALRLATEAYDKIDDSIRALDWDIGMLEPQMAAAAAEDYSTLDPQILAIKRKEQRKAQRQGKRRARELAVQKKKRLGKRGLPEDLGLVASVGPGQGTTEGDDDVDPNEPVYCTCQRVSYGQMVGCDNEDCRFEWFHLDCVGLVAPPTGNWLCPDCCNEKELAYQGAVAAPSAESAQEQADEEKKPSRADAQKSENRENEIKGANEGMAVHEGEDGKSIGEGGELSGASEKKEARNEEREESALPSAVADEAKD